MHSAETAPRSWDPIAGGKRAWVCFEDEKTYDLGLDGPVFDVIADRMLGGRY